MYRQRKRDLNLKPNRQLDKRSSRGMIYENEELRMRTIAICEDVDRGQNDIKKLRKENEHLKREIWGLRDECEKLEGMLKQVCISANIPEIQLESSSKKYEDDDYDDEPPDDDDDDDRYLKGRRRESGTSVMTYDSEMASCMTSMFGDDPEDDIGFAVDDTDSVKNQVGTIDSVMVVEAVVEPRNSGVAYDKPHGHWGHAAVPDLEAVREESESAVNSPMASGPLDNPLKALEIPDNFDVLPDPTTIFQPSSSSPGEGVKHPLIQITPASSPTFISGPESPDVVTGNEGATVASSSHDNFHSIGVITVVPKTFKVTSEIVVGDSKLDGGDVKTLNNEHSDLGMALALANNSVLHPVSQYGAGATVQSKSVEFSRKIIPSKDSAPISASKSGDIPTDSIVVNHRGILTTGWGGCHRKSCYLPAQGFPTTPHRSFGMLGCCCSDYLNGYQSEPSLTSSLTSPQVGKGFIEENPSSFFNAFCCRTPVPSMSSVPPVRSVWNTVDKNIVIGFYDSASTGDLKVQEIIDELESKFDPTLENILGIRIVPGRLFISLKNSSVVQSFLTNFKHDLFLSSNCRVHFIEGASKWSTLVLSGIPQELSDLAVISTLNHFGQVVAPLERRNYKGVDISERIARMHLVISESNVPEYVKVSGYDIRIRVEKEPVAAATSGCASTGGGDKMLKHGQNENTSGHPPPTLKHLQAPTKYGFVAPPPVPQTNNLNSHPTTGASGLTSSSLLKPHKPVIRSSSSAPRLETPAPGTLCLLPTVEQKRQASVCVGNIPVDQHPSKLIDMTNGGGVGGQKQQVTIVPAQGQQTTSTPNLQPHPKKPLARLLVSSPGSFLPSPLGSPTSPDDSLPETTSGGGGLKAFYKNFDIRRGSAQQGKIPPTESRQGHNQLTPSSSYSPKGRRKSSVQFVGGRRMGGKREPLPWCGCWGLGCGN